MNIAQLNNVEGDGVLTAIRSRRGRRLMVSGGTASALGLVAALTASSVAAGGVAPQLSGIVTSINNSAHTFTVQSSPHRAVVDVDGSTDYLSRSACYLGLVAIKVGERVAVRGRVSDGAEIASIVYIDAATPSARRSAQL